MNHVTIRSAVPGDAPAMLAVYKPYVLETAITFEYDVPSIAEFERRVRGVLPDFPWLVCEIDGKTAGYAYASHFHPRAAYQWDAEVSIYLSAAFHRHGVGSALYGCMEAILKKQGVLNLYALITHPNLPSERFHAEHGYTPVGIYKTTGYKFGVWHDLIVMEKQLAPLPQAPVPCTPFPQLDGDFLQRRYTLAEQTIKNGKDG